MPGQHKEILIGKAKYVSVVCLKEMKEEFITFNKVVP
jgi:hypothetical protein